MSRKLTLDDIADVRAYERERDRFRHHVIELKRPRRVHLGTNEQHAQGLTREAVTAAVHYLRWELTPGQIEAFADGSAYLAIDHPAYLEQVELSDTTRADLLADPAQLNPSRGVHELPLADRADAF